MTSEQQHITVSELTTYLNDTFVNHRLRTGVPESFDELQRQYTVVYAHFEKYLKTLGHISSQKGVPEEFRNAIVLNMKEGASKLGQWQPLADTEGDEWNLDLDLAQIAHSLFKQLSDLRHAKRLGKSFSFRCNLELPKRSSQASTDGPSHSTFFVRNQALYEKAIANLCSSLRVLSNSYELSHKQLLRAYYDDLETLASYESAFERFFQNLIEHVAAPQKKGRRRILQSVPYLQRLLSRTQLSSTAISLAKRIYKNPPRREISVEHLRDQEAFRSWATQDLQSRIQNLLHAFFMAMEEGTGLSLFGTIDWGKSKPSTGEDISDAAQYEFFTRSCRYRTSSRERNPHFEISQTIVDARLSSVDDLSIRVPQEIRPLIFALPSSLQATPGLFQILSGQLVSETVYERTNHKSKAVEVHQSEHNLSDSVPVLVFASEIVLAGVHHPLN